MYVCTTYVERLAGPSSVNPDQTAPEEQPDQGFHYDTNFITTLKLQVVSWSYSVLV